MRLMRSLRFVVSLVAALLLTGACSAPVDSGPKAIGAATIPEGLRSGPTSTTTSTTAPSGESEEVTVYFIGPDQRLVAVKRTVSPPVTVEKVLQKLFAGPTIAEKSVTGLRTAISFDTRVLSAPVEDKIALVDVSKTFAFGPVDDQIRAYAQVVFTTVDVEGVTGVLFSVNGRRQEAPDGDGSNQSAPLGRGSYPESTPR